MFSVYHNTLQIAHYQQARITTEEAKPCGFFNVLEQSSSTTGGNSSRAIRMRSALGVENFPRRDNFRNTNDVDFVKQYHRTPR